MNEYNQDQGSVSQEDVSNPDGAVEAGNQGTVAESNLTDSEQELEQLRVNVAKDQRHASRKITELSQGNQQLEQSNYELQQAQTARDQRIANLESQLQTLSQQQQSSGGYYDDDGSTTSNNSSVTADEWNLYKQGVGEMANEVYALKEQLDSVNSQRQEQSQVQEYVARYGLSEEDAQLALQYQQNQDFFNAHRVVELGAANAKARSEARNRRNSTPSDIGSASSSNAGPTNDAQTIDNIMQGRQSPNDVARQLAEDPSLLDKLAKGFRLGQS